MNIDGQAEFEHTGNTYLQVRDCLRVMGNQLFVHRRWYEQWLAKDLKSAAAVFDIRIEQGYLTEDGTIAVSVWNPETRHHEQVVEPRYHPTSKGHAWQTPARRNPCTAARRKRLWRASYKEWSKPQPIP